MGISRKLRTKSIKLANLVESPIASHFTIIGPLTNTNPASTISPSEIPTGIGSPVNGARSISPFPSIIFPSTGTTSPDLISIISPTLNAWIGTQSFSFEP